ncbi:histidine phosphatase family protein [Viridibacillus sp. YIM B01967]|uniref:Histidine phosphatase family protein n=1 Tax=Viridibacillus soli TaxID=2798301 RepID=A0ABS1H6A8_9BACL|nr:histidine phosphatase family protein [Viridibacillus soli]MBK3494925.1 histidine phosphatase family protein [Viridibacillus soli]
MTEICVVRHGETDWNALGKLQGVTDVPLNDRGIQQAKECGQFLKESEWAAIFTSPLTRAKRTAEIINEQLQIPLIEIDQFKERAFGDAEGMDPEERLKAFPNKQYTNQEHFDTVLARLRDGLAEIHEQYPNDRVILVAHGAVIHSLFTLLENGDIFPQQVRLANAGVSYITIQEDRWLLGDFNQSSHLSQVSEIGKV